MSFHGQYSIEMTEAQARIAVMKALSRRRHTFQSLDTLFKFIKAHSKKIVIREVIASAVAYLEKQGKIHYQGGAICIGPPPSNKSHKKT